MAILDPSNFSSLGTVSIGLWPERMAVSPDGKRLYVAKSDPNRPTANRPPQGGLAVIDTATNEVSQQARGVNGPPRRQAARG